MKPFLEVEYLLRATDFDCRYQLQPASVLELFQDAAGRHSIEMGVGYQQFAPKNLLWVLSGVRFQVIKTPEMYQRVKVITWPLPPSAVTFQRECRMEDMDGNLLVKGSSDWAVVDGLRRKIVPAKGIYPPSFVPCEERCFADKAPRLRDFEPAGEGKRIVPGFAELDINGHVNNTKYANFILDAVDWQPQERIDTFQIHYRKEMMAGQAVTLYTRREEAVLSVMGKSDGGESMFHCRITLA